MEASSVASVVAAPHVADTGYSSWLRFYCSLIGLSFSMAPHTEFVNLLDVRDSHTGSPVRNRFGTLNGTSLVVATEICRVAVNRFETRSLLLPCQGCGLMVRLPSPAHVNRRKKTPKLESGRWQLGVVWRALQLATNPVKGNMPTHGLNSYTHGHLIAPRNCLSHSKFNTRTITANLHKALPRHLTFA